MEPFTRDLLDRTKSLVGRQLIGVRCDDGDADAAGRLAYGAGAAHSVSVDLLFDTQVVSVVSSDEFTDGTYELSLRVEPIGEDQDPHDASAMMTRSPWSDLIGETIESSKLHWVDSPYVELSKRRKAFSSHHFDVDGAVPFAGPKAPLALELHFTNGGRVLFVAGGWRGDDEPIAETGSGISVLWEADTFARLVPRIARELKRSWR